MKFFAACFLLAFACQTALAADTTIVKVMQRIIDIEVDKSYQYFYLYNTANKPSFDKNTIKEVNSRNPKNIPLSVLNEFLYAVKSDTLPFKWSNHRLPRAKYTDNKHLPKQPDIAKLIKGLPNVDSLGHVTKSVEPKDYKTWQNFTRFAFSNPVFSIDKQYALVTTGNDDGGARYILKRINGTWQIVYHINWVACSFLSRR